MNNHVIILGWDGFSERLLLELYHSNIPVGIACTDSADALRDKYGSLSDVRILEMTSYEAIGQLEQLDAGSAGKFFVNLESDEEKLLRVVDIAERTEWSGDIDVVLEHERLEDTFKDAGVRYAVSRQEVSSKLLATYIYEPDVAEVTERLFTSTRPKDGRTSPEVIDSEKFRDVDAKGSFDIQEHQLGPDFELPDSQPLDNNTYAFGDVLHKLRNEFGAVPLALHTNDSLTRLPAPDTPVSVGDHLLIALSREDENDIRSILDASPGKRPSE